MIPYHIQQRLNERAIIVDLAKLEKIALNCECDSAILIQRLNCYTADYSGSNGDLVIMIVRNRTPITIMFRRSNQPFTPDNLRVNKILDLTI